MRWILWPLREWRRRRTIRRILAHNRMLKAQGVVLWDNDAFEMAAKLYHGEPMTSEQVREEFERLRGMMR